MINRFKIFSKIMLSAMASSLLAVNVTLNVDMSNVTVSEDGVHVAGSFQGWDPAGTPLADDDGDGIYTVVVDMSGVTDETVFFKYINGNSWGNDETVSDPACGGAGGFASDRFLDVPDVDTVLDPVCFSECIGCDESYVTFHVDMANTEVADEGIFLGGGQWHNNYQLMTLVPDEETLYMVKVAIPLGDHYYKFNNGGNDGGYEDGGSLGAEGCGDSDNWGDRTISVGEEDSMTPPFCFSSCYSCGGTPTTANITFQADMSVLQSQGWDDNAHFLELRGGMNGWSAGDVFEQDLLDPSLYSFTKEITAVPGSMHTWKFKANPDENFNNNGWETGSDRVLYFEGEDMVLDAELPNILPVGPLANAVEVEIHATWIEGTLNANNGEPFPMTPDTLVMNGSFLNCWCTWGNCMGSTCDEKVSPDVPRLTDPDGDVLIPHGFKAPSGSFVANEDGGVLYTPDESFFGDTVNIQYSVKDSDGLTVQASRQLFVSDRITGGFNLDVNKDGSVTALGDGLMVISELFANASSGESLTHYASTSNAAFSKSITHQFIQQGADVQVGDTYAALDVDRDGEVTASGDGLMVIRYLLGSTFTGSALTDNAISPHSLYDSQSRPWELVQENINALLPPNV